MNDQLQNALTDFVNRLTALVDSGTAQLPAVLQDIIAYKLFSAWFHVFFGVGGLALATLLAVVAVSRDEYSESKVVFTVLGVISGIIGVLFALGGTYSVYYVSHFPRLVILDYLKGLL
jgi:hypothetical protein